MANLVAMNTKPWGPRDQAQGARNILWTVMDPRIVADTISIILTINNNNSSSSSSSRDNMDLSSTTMMMTCGNIKFVREVNEGFGVVVLSSPFHLRNIWNFILFQGQSLQPAPFSIFFFLA